MDRILGVNAARRYLLAIAVCAPVVMTRLIGTPPLTHDAYELPKAVLVRILVAAAFLAWSTDFARGRVKLYTTRWFAVIAVLVGWTALATVFSAARATSVLGMYGRLDGLLASVTYGLIAFLGVQCFRTGKDFVSLGRALSVSGLIVGVYGVLQSFGLDPFFYFETNEFTLERVFATFGNPVFLGGFIVLVLPLIATTALTEDSRTWKMLSWAAATALLVTLVATATRTAWVVGALEVLLLVVLAIRAKLAPSRVGLAALGVAGAGGVMLVVRSLTAASAEANLLSRFSALLQINQGSGLERTLVARAALSAIAARPVLGWGPDRFAVAFERFRSAEHAALFSGTVDNAHSVPLQIAATVGVVGAVAWVVAVMWPLVTSAKRIRAAGGASARVLAAGAWLSCAGYALFLVAGISVTGATAVFWLLLAALSGITASESGIAQPSWTRGAAVALGSVLVLLALTSGAASLGANNRYLLERRIVRGDAVGDAVAVLKVAQSLDPFTAHYAKELTLLVTSGPELRAALESALELAPDDYVLLMRLAALDALEGDAGGAASNLKKAREAAPATSRMGSSDATAVPTP